MKAFRIISLLLVISSKIIASHIIGGKITYRHLGNNKYEYKLSVYRDCSDQVDFDSPAYVSIYDKGTLALVSNKPLALSSRSIVPSISPNPCFLPPPGICVEIGIYLDTVILQPNNYGYSLAYQRCCRNLSVINILLPSVNGITIAGEIPPQSNNSSQFNNSPPIYICLNDTFNYSFASTDIDGDSLVYSFCDLLNGGSIGNIAPNPASPPPYTPMLWSAGFNTTNQLPSSVGMILNSQTGQFKFKPSIIGQFSFGICVKEYRNGVLLNINRLEIQFNVVPCYLTSSIPTATNLCEGLTINFQNNSTNANGFHWDFGVPNTLVDTSAIHTPTFTYPSYGTYTVTLIVSNNSYGFCKDTARRVINIHPLLAPTLTPQYSKCFNNNLVTFNVGGAFQPQTMFQWNFTPQSNSQYVWGNPVNSHFTTAQTKTVSVVINQFGCIDTLYSVISFSNPLASVNSGLLNCNEKNLFFSNLSSNAAFFKWNFGDLTTTGDTSSLANPSYTYSSYGHYRIMLIASDGQCTDTLKETIHVFPKLELKQVVPALPQCFRNHSFNFSANGIYSPNAQFSWIIGTDSSVFITNVENPTNIRFKRPGVYPVRLTIEENGCKLQRTEIVRVLASPSALVRLSDSVVCEPGSIYFRQVLDTTLNVNYDWTINGEHYNDTTVFYVFPNAGVYSFSVIAAANNGCTDTLIKRNSIRINPTPKAHFNVEPLYSTILEPNITYTDSTYIAHYTFMDFGDGQSSDNTRVRHTYDFPGQYYYSLIAYNEFGCADTVRGSIYIDDIGANYVPNVFTPNGDNVNEHFFIRGESISSSQMIIRNRWGGKVFESDNALEGWDGIEMHTGEPCSDGTYFYEIKIVLDNLRKYKFTGTLQLVR